MEIAVIGWGSLIWCPGSLRIKTKWRSDGPRLPIEFARISRDGRLTLVILPGADDQQLYWALSEFESLGDACRNLKERESCALKHIHCLTAEGRAATDVHAMVDVCAMVTERVRDWLAARKGVDAAIWTGLITNWCTKRGRKFTLDDAVRYLNELESERDRAATTYDRAQKYVKNTPLLIQTNVRRAMQREGWKDTELPKVLFED